MVKEQIKRAAPGSVPGQQYWIGVVGRRDSWERLLAHDLWWCFSPSARVGDKLAMYLTQSVSPKGAGIFAIYELTALDPDRSADCKGFGSLAVGLFNVFAHMRLVRAVEPVVTLGRLRRDPVMRETRFVRRNAQGTAFELSKREFLRLEAFCRSGTRGEGG